MTAALDRDAMLAVARAYADATRRGDRERIDALTEPDALVWHAFDESVAERAASERTVEWLQRTVPDITWEDVAFHTTEHGFVWQAVITGTAPGGLLRAHTCMVVSVSPPGRIARTDEYVDTAQLAVLYG